MHFNKLTPAEAERLALLAEECGEVIQAVAKILRHGYESCHPDSADPADNNRVNLEHELGDVMAAVKMMGMACDVSADYIGDCREDKLQRVNRYLHHAKVQP